MNVKISYLMTVKLALYIGVRFTIGSGLKRLFHLVYYIQFKSNKKTFEFRGRKYSCFHHYYDTTWYNERAVEIPIIVEIVRYERHLERYLR